VEIEREFGKEMVWERLDEKKNSRISYRLYGVDIRNRETWHDMKEFFCENLPKFEEVFKGCIRRANSFFEMRRRYDSVTY
jgi:hypothetical protein